MLPHRWGSIEPDWALQVAPKESIDVAPDSRGQPYQLLRAHVAQAMLPEALCCSCCICYQSGDK